MTDQPTPETDAEMLLRPPSFNPADMAYKFARALEIQRNAARAERDALRQTAHNNSVFWSARDGTGELRHYKAAPEEASKLIVALGNERDALRAALDEYGERMARSDANLAILIADRGTLRAALELIAVPMRIDGTYTIGRDECGYIAREALATSAK